MDTKLTEKCFAGMGGVYAALFTPYDAKGCVNPEMIEQIVNYGIKNGLNGFYLTAAQYKAYAKQFAKLGIVEEGHAHLPRGYVTPPDPTAHPAHGRRHESGGLFCG